MSCSPVRVKPSEKFPSQSRPERNSAGRRGRRWCEDVRGKDRFCRGRWASTDDLLLHRQCGQRRLQSKRVCALCESLGTGDAFVKSASYLMHRANFSDVRNFLLGHTRLILQDDSGIPLSRFDQAGWRLRPFGHYSGPIALFANRYQPKLTQLFNQRPVELIDFGIGYRWHPQNSSLVVAVRTDAATGNAAGRLAIRRGRR